MDANRLWLRRGRIESIAHARTRTFSIQSSTVTTGDSTVSHGGGLGLFVVHRVSACSHSATLNCNVAECICRQHVSTCVCVCVVFINTSEKRTHEDPICALLLSVTRLGFNSTTNNSTEPYRQRRRHRHHCQNTYSFRHIIIIVISGMGRLWSATTTTKTAASLIGSAHLASRKGKWPDNGVPNTRKTHTTHATYIIRLNSANSIVVHRAHRIAERQL